MGAEDKAGTRLPVIGTGAHTYEATHNWGALPKHIHWGDTHGVRLRRGRADLHQARSRTPRSRWTPSSSSIPTGKFVRSFGKEFHRGGHGIDIRKEGRRAVPLPVRRQEPQGGQDHAQRRDRLEHGHAEGAGRLPEAARATSPPTSPSRPTAASTSATATARSYIHQYDKDAKWVRTWGGAGQARPAR